VSALRRALGPAGAALLVTRPPGYALEVEPERVDAARFERLVAEAGRVPAAEQGGAAGLLEQALGLWRGPALAEFAGLPFARAEAARLEELRIDPSPELQRLHRAILTQDPSLEAAAMTAVAAPPHNLPERLTSLVGREGELRGLGELLARHRLVTVTGPGGVGKTSLAVEAARRLVGAYPDGVWLVELAPLTDPGLVAEAAVAALVLVGFAWAALGRGDAGRAALPLGAAGATRERIGVAPVGAERREAVLARQAARSRLGERAFQAATAAGRDLPADQALRVALQSNR
jgi:hypothetical protein